MSTLQAGDTVDVAGDGLAVLLTPESAQGQSPNADPDQLDRVLQVWNADTSVRVPTGQAAEEYAIGPSLVAFRTRESAQNQNLNPASGDTDTGDDVLQLWDTGRPECLGATPPADCRINTGQAVTPCRLQACDPRRPYRVFTDTGKFLTFEDDQGVDLNNDDDLADLVIQVFNARTRIAKVVGTVGATTTAGDPLGGDPTTGAGGATIFVTAGRCIETVASSCASCGNGGFCEGGTCKRDQGVCQTTTDCPGAATCEPRAIVPASADSDGDGVPDHLDNCRTTPNTDQVDGDDDGAGRACDRGGDYLDVTDPRAKAIVRARGDAGVVSAKLTVTLPEYAGETAAVTLLDSDGTIVAETVGALPPRGRSVASGSTRSRAMGSSAYR